MTTSTSLRLNPDLVKQAKIYAIEHNTTLTKIVETGIRAVIDAKLQSGIARELVIRAKDNSKGDMPFE